jgi:hypothetical protein
MADASEAAPPENSPIPATAAGETSAPEAAAAAPRTAFAWAAKLRTTAATVTPSRSALVASGIGFAAGAGLLLATIGAMGVGRLIAAPNAKAAPSGAAVEETRVLKQTVSELGTQVAALKASVESANRQASNQRAQIAERYQRDARAQTELQSRLAKIGDTVERLEKRVTAAAAAETTGSVAPRYAAAAAETQLPAAEAKPLARPPVAAGWSIRDVFRGRAVVASRRGLFEAAPGMHLPELGRVEAVTRENGRWVVVAEKGIITTMRRPRAVYGYEAD